MIVWLHNDNKSNKTVKISPFPPFLFIQPNNTSWLEKDNNPQCIHSSLSFPPLAFKRGQNTSIFTPHYQTTHTHHVYISHIARTNNIIKGENKSEKSYTKPIHAFSSPLSTLPPPHSSYLQEARDSNSCIFKWQREQF